MTPANEKVHASWKSYSGELAFAKARRASRTGIGIMPNSKFWDSILGLLYSPVARVIASYVRTRYFGLLQAASTAATVEVENISVSDGSNTARFVMFFRAVYASFGMGTDILAPQLLLSDAGHFSSEARAGTVRLYRLLLTSFRLFRRDPIRDLVVNLGPEVFGFDLCTYMHLRTCWLDDVVEAFALQNSGEDAQVVILGAGYDTRCYRLPSLKGSRRGHLSLFEVDTKSTQEDKLRTLSEVGVDSSHVCFTAADFTQPNGWQKTLIDAGARTTLPTCIVWEGVTMYLTREQVTNTLRSVRELFPAGSIIAFDYHLSSYVQDPVISGIIKEAGEPFDFGLSSPLEAGDTDVQRLLSGAGLVLLEHLNSKDLCERYAPRRADGSLVGILLDHRHGGVVVGGVV